MLLPSGRRTPLRCSMASGIGGNRNQKSPRTCPLAKSLSTALSTSRCNALAQRFLLPFWPGLPIVTSEVGFSLYELLKSLFKSLMIQLTRVGRTKKTWFDQI